jgi:hypothetical protein
MALGSTQPLTKKYVPGIFLGGKGRPPRKADNLTAICEPIVQKMWEPRRHTTLRPSRPVTGIALPLRIEVLTAVVMKCLLSSGI